MGIGIDSALLSLKHTNLRGVASALPKPERSDTKNPDGHPDGVSARGQVDEDSRQNAGGAGVEQAVPEAVYLGNVAPKNHEALEANTHSIVTHYYPSLKRSPSPAIIIPENIFDQSCLYSNNKYYM